MIIAASETLKNGSVSANSNNVNYPVSNVFDSRLSRLYKTVAAITTAEIVFDAGAAVTVNSISIANHNISSSVTTLKWQGNETNAWTSPSVDETLVYSSGIINKQFTGGSYRYWRLQVVDATNTDTFISIGRIYGSEQSNPPPISPSFSHTRISESRKSIGISGSVYGDKRYFYDLISINWSIITQAEKALIIAWFETLDITDPFFIIFDESDMDLEAQYVTIDSPQVSFNYKRNPKWQEASMTFRESK